MSDLLYDWFGFNQTCKSVSNSTYVSKAGKSEQIKQEVSRTDFLLRTKWVFSGLVLPLALRLFCHIWQYSNPQPM